MNDADRERIIDRAVQRRLATDAAYRNAANAEEQAEREDEITRQEEQALERSAFRSRMEQARL